MSGLLDGCAEYFGTRNLYDALGIPSTASPEDVKRAYFKLSLKIHPDKVSDDVRELATKKFQTLGKVYAVLSDGDKRSAYDESGDIDDETENGETDWAAYWRLVFKKTTVKDIDEYKDKYQGSQEEKDDLKEAYLKFKGDMDKITDWVPFAEVDEEPRLRVVLFELIETEKMPAYEKFTNEDPVKSNKRKRKARREAGELKKSAEESSGDNDGLVAALMRNQARREQNMDGLLASLEAKYCRPSGQKSKSRGSSSSPSPSARGRKPKK